MNRFLTGRAVGIIGTAIVAEAPKEHPEADLYDRDWPEKIICKDCSDLIRPVLASG
jgi:hypothetical protein